MDRSLRTILASLAAPVLAAAGLLVPAHPANAAVTLDHAVTLNNAVTHNSAVTLNNSDVTANLWEWNWNSVAKACTTQLGPAGYGAVQVAPPAESVSLASTDNGAHPWWEVYQPVSYNLTSRMGNRTQFAAMVTACHNAGVRVYVDAVVNHTAGSNNTTNGTYGGSTFSPSGFTYPAVPYSYDDFHHPNDGYCNDSDGVIDDFNNTSEVQNCALLSLSDLKTQSSTVRAKIAAYLNDLIGLGVDGFRVDAAKHIAQADFAGILALLNRTTAENKAPYIAQEVVAGSSNSQLTPSAFTANGDVLGFSYAMALKNQFNSGTLNNLASIPSWSLDASSDRTAAMVTNHDLERDATTLRYLDGSKYVLANYFLLAYPYGRPFVFDGFTFPTSNTGQSPPADGNGFITDTDCGNGAWQCLTQSAGLKGMVGWHNATAGTTTVADFTATNNNVIGFHRGSLGWVGLNNSGSASTATYRTGLADGSYCDVISGVATSTGCSGTAVTVAGGNASVTIPAGGAVAIDVNARGTGGGTTPPPPTSCSTVAVSFAATVTTTFGQNVYVLGNQAALSNWDTGGGVALSSAAYPVWKGTVNLPPNTAIEYKYVKKEGSTVTWESGANRTADTGSACTLTLTDSWK